MSYRIPYLSELKANGNFTHAPLKEYYAIMPDLTVQYICDECDLAVVSFTSDEKLVMVNIASEVALRGDRIMCIGNPYYYPGHFKATYGKIISGMTLFEADGSKNTVQRHNAYVAPGSSGGAVYDENMELVGIHIGGGVDVFGRFRFGAMISCDQIKKCLENWKKE